MHQPPYFVGFAGASSRGPVNMMAVGSWTKTMQEAATGSLQPFKALYTSKNKR